MKFTSLIVALIATSLCANAAKKATWPSGFEGANTEIYKTIDDVELRVHIFSPATESKKPTAAIVFFFGGGWKGGTPKQFEQHCRYLASRGMVAMTAEYRIRNLHQTLAKACVSDGKSAIRWVRTNSKRLGVDPDRIVAAGGSAGGHVAACTGVIQGFEDEKGESSRPNAMVLFNPALVLAPIADSELPFPKDKMDELSERMGVDPKRLSPWHNVSKGAPPTLTLHGKADPTVAYWTSRVFHEKMVKSGNRSELAGYADQPHGFFNFGKDKNKMFSATVKRADKFLVSLGYLKGKDSVDQFLKQN